MISARSARPAPGASAVGGLASSGHPAPGASRVGALDFLRRGLGAAVARRLEVYVSAVTVLGVSTITFLAIRDAAAGPPWLPATPAAIVLAVLTFGSELVPIRIDRDGDVEEVTTSTTFGFAIMLLVGTAPAVYVLAVSSAVSDAVRRKPLRKILFNLGQYSIIMAIAGGLYASLGGGPGASNMGLAPLLTSSLAFFVLNTVLTGVVVAISEQVPVVAHVRTELPFNATVAVTLLAMSPVVALVADRSVPLLLVFLLPVGAVQLAAKGSIERAALIERLRASLDQMTELNRAKDEFVAVVSHELRTPLTSVRGYVRTMLHLGDDLSATDVRVCLEAADRQAERLQQQIERLLFVASADSRRDRLGPVHPVSVVELVRSIVTDMQPVLDDHRVVLHLDEDVQPVRTDEASLTHVLMNLLENAAKYSPGGTEIDVDVRSEIDGVVVAVRDRGPGIAEEHRERIFERFYQADSSNTRAVGGTGLGLYIAASCARDLGGRVWLERSDASGSEFCVQVPSIPGRDAPGDRSTASAITAIASA